jgi:hypothetical protein
VKKRVKDIRSRLLEISQELEEIASTPKLSSMPINGEKFSMVVHSFSLKVSYMAKCLNEAIFKLPAEPKEVVKLSARLKNKPKTSQNLLQLIKIINPKEIEFNYIQSGRKVNSRTECAKILKEVRKLERENAAKKDKKLSKDSPGP